MEDDAIRIQSDAGPAFDVPRRRLIATLALSLVAHTALVLSLGASGAWRSHDTQVASVTVHITTSAVPAPREEPQPAAATDLPRPETSLAPATESTRRTAPPSVPQQARAGERTLGALPAADDLPAAESLIATTGESEPVIRIAEIPALRLSVNPVPPAAPPEVVVRRVSEWIHSLQSTDPRRAELSWQQDGRPYKAVLTRRAAGDATDLDRYDIEVVTPAETGSWVTGLRLRRLAFSHFTQFVDRWDSGVQLHDDEIAGRFHANNTIVIGYDRKVAPRFLGKVTSAGRGFRIADSFGRRRSEEIFRGGVETGVERISLPRHLAPIVEGAERTGGHRREFERDTRIRFHADGSYGWSELRRRSAWAIEQPADQPVYLVAAPGIELHVSGIVRGQVLVYSPERIVVEGDLRYARDPRIDPDTEDMLGLISERRVEIGRPYLIGRRDLEICAAIYAGRRFVVSDTDAPRAGTLRIYGSLTAGTLSETEPRYATKIDFDPRFEERRPPGFPMAPRFELEAVDAAWRFEDGPRAN